MRETENRLERNRGVNWKTGNKMNPGRSKMVCRGCYSCCLSQLCSPSLMFVGSILNKLSLCCCQKKKKSLVENGRETSILVTPFGVQKGKPCKDILGGKGYFNHSKTFHFKTSWCLAVADLTNL